MHWILFFISALLIVISGVQLTRCADKLSDALGLGKIWIGAALLGVVTSLPEAVTSLASVISVGSVDLAVGNILGSNNFNPMLIVVMDFFYRKGAITNDMAYPLPQQVAVAFAFFLTLIVWAGLTFSDIVELGPIAPVGLVLIAAYLIGIKTIARVSPSESEKSGVLTPMSSVEDGRLMLVVKFILSTVVIVLSAVWLAQTADTIAVKTGLGRTFVGSLFLAVVTSLPEIVVSLSALKLGVFDLAVGNIFGSNMANLCILGLCDIVNKSGSVLRLASGAHQVTVILNLVLMGLVFSSSRYRKGSLFGIGYDSYLMLACFLGGSVVLYIFS